MFFIEKKQDGTRCIKKDNWYVVLTPTGGGTKHTFTALYYENGRTKLQFKVSKTYNISEVKELESEKGKPKLKKRERISIMNKMKEFFKMFFQMDRLEEMEQNCIVANKIYV